MPSNNSSAVQVMRPKTDPVRLSADLSTSAKLREALADGRRQLPTQGDVQRLSSRVEAAILAGVPAPNWAPLGKAGLTGKAGFTGLAAKIGVVAVASAGIVASGLFLSARHSSHVGPTASAQALAPSATAIASALLPLSSSEATPTVLAPRSLDDSAKSPSPASSPTNATASHENGTTPVSESVLLNQARSALRSNPRRALALTQEHAKRFANGVLAQEREVIAIEALSRLGQSDTASSRARDFERRFPGSAHQSKVDQLTREK
jgi:hypothetical protein